MKTKSIKDSLALALDNCSSLERIDDLIAQTRDSIGIYKVGLEQFTRFGPSIVERIIKKDVKVFLDLKLHDIPNTVAKAVESVCELGVHFLTIHAFGGLSMMRAATDAAKNATTRGKISPKIIGVTVLTSISEEMLKGELNVAKSLEQQVADLAGLAAKAGLDGIVCSAADLLAVKPMVPQHFEIITPGIRFDGGATHDQKRVATPQEAIKNGATILVLGRAVTEAKSPGDAAKGIVEALKLSV